MNEILEDVKKYYGKVLKTSDDLVSSACCCSDSALSKEVKDARNLIPDEILTKSYGCGSPIPPSLEGMTVLDLGCGTGIDVYTASKLVGEKGNVIGIDMTDEQLDVAKKYQDEMREKFGHKKSNVRFVKGYIEDLHSAGIEESSIDVVISNCVINLSPYKEKIFKEIQRVLKPGGELYFSDVFADRRLPEELSNDPVLRGECIGGAMYYEDFRRIMQKSGFTDLRNYSSRQLTLDNEIMIDKVGFATFYERTIRAFKLDDLEDICEDYGQVGIYNGGISGCIHYFDLDDHHRFYTGKPMLICGNTASMISKTRFAPAFTVIGDRSTHYGAFEGCGTSGETAAEDDGESCCC